jgi:hypothetical protein
MSSDDHFYDEFEVALRDVLAEREFKLDRRTRLAKARAAVNKDDPRYRRAVDRAFQVLDG